eukprot:1551456-Amphidinium_carterae.1
MVSNGASYFNLFLYACFNTKFYLHRTESKLKNNSNHGAQERMSEKGKDTYFRTVRKNRKPGGSEYVGCSSVAPEKPMNLSNKPGP